jgi:RNA polymerase sigma-70 factor (ECF subfamily)
MVESQGPRGGESKGTLSDIILNLSAGDGCWAKGAIAYARGARFTQPALVNGAVGVVLAPSGRLLRVLTFTSNRGKIARIDVVADPASLSQLDLAVLDH